jgi:glycosyltransferase involved in cell wall biosynthesis
MIEVDVIILSWCKDDSYFYLNQNCIQSLIDSEKNIAFRILIVESNRDWSLNGRQYDLENVVVIVPDEDFNFNRFLNIGIAATQSETIILANNDLTFHPGWFSEILKVKAFRSDISSFCPFDRESGHLAWEKVKDRTFILGYRVPIEFVGWCVVIERTAL